jgi:amino acid transporter
LAWHGDLETRSQIRKLHFSNAGDSCVSAISRLFSYVIACAALPVLRKKQPGKEGFHLPGGVALAVLGILFALVLVSQMGRAELIALLITAAVSFLNWFVVRGKTNPSVDRLRKKS